MPMLLCWVPPANDAELPDRIRPRLDPKNFGFWLTVAFRLYLIISV